jgi:hypothetical protein
LASCCGMLILAYRHIVTCEGCYVKLLRFIRFILMNALAKNTRWE